MSTLKVLSQDSTKIVAGKLTTETFFYVGDADGNLVGRKAHATEADAQSELAGLGGFAEGLEFAKAQFPKLGEKAHVGKANVIAEFLAWQAAGKPVKSVEEDTSEPELEVEPTEEAPAADEAF